MGLQSLENFDVAAISGFPIECYPAQKLAPDFCLSAF